MFQEYDTLMNRLPLFSLILALCVAAVLTACDGDDPVTVTCIDGSGTVITEQRSPGEFTGIIHEGNIDIRLLQGDYDVRVEADDNFMPRIRTELRGDKLFIGTDDDICLRNGTAIVYLTTPAIKSISSTGSGSVRGRATFPADAFNVSSKGSAEIQVTGATTRSVSVAIGGSGSVTVSGNAELLAAQVSGSGSLHAFQLPVNEALISLSGSGSARINVRDKIEGTLSGSGTIEYMGNPTLFVVVSGSGVVRKR